jgi:hypothetical protein
MYAPTFVRFSSTKDGKILSSIRPVKLEDHLQIDRLWIAIVIPAQLPVGRRSPLRSPCPSHWHDAELFTELSTVVLVSATPPGEHRAGEDRRQFNSTCRSEVADPLLIEVPTVTASFGAPIRH